VNYVTLKITEVGNNSIFGTYYVSPNNVTWNANYTDITLGNLLAANGSITSGNEYSISWVINGTSGLSGTSGVNGTSGTGFNTLSSPADYRILSASGSSTNNAVANNNLTYDGNILTVTGNATVSGTSSNLIRRSYGLVAFDTEVNLDDIYASVTDAGQLRLRTPGTWRATGWTETFKIGSPTVQNWINLNISGAGYGSASEVMSDLQGYGCRCIIGDQSPSAKLYSITVVNLGVTGNRWAIAVERLV